jgi:hypothetical protein
MNVLLYLSLFDIKTIDLPLKRTNICLKRERESIHFNKIHSYLKEKEKERNSIEDFKCNNEQ